MSTNRRRKTPPPIPPADQQPNPSPKPQPPADTTDKRTPVRKRPPADRARAAAMHAAGHEPADIAAALKVGIDTVYRWRKQGNWPRPNDLQTNQPAVLNSGQHLPEVATDPQAQSVLVRHRAQLEAFRKQLDDILAMPDLGAGPKGSPSQAAERVSAALARFHQLERQAHGMGESGAGGTTVNVIVVPQRAGSSADWSRDVREVVGAVVDVTARSKEARRTGRKLSTEAGGGSLVGTRSLLAIPAETGPAGSQGADPATTPADSAPGSLDRDPFHRDDDR